MNMGQAPVNFVQAKATRMPSQQGACMYIEQQVPNVHHALSTWQHVHVGDSLNACLSGLRKDEGREGVLGATRKQAQVTGHHDGP